MDIPPAHHDRSATMTRRHALKLTAAAPLLGAADVRAAPNPGAPADPLATLDAIAQAELVRRGEVSPRELVDAAIRRIEATDPRINAVVERHFEQARARAESKDLPNGPLRGVPTLVKDAAIAGAPSVLGSELLAKLDIRAQLTDEFVLRTERAGMIVLGRSNVPELMSAATTESRLHGAAHNPWDLSRSTGGSSGGAAAAVAALMVPAAHSSDGGGSTRIPASANGVVGLKPSRGRVTMAPASTDWVDITPARSWLTRSVRDTALLLDVVAGTGYGDTLTAPTPQQPYWSDVTTPPGALRIGFMRQLPGNTTAMDSEAIRAVEQTAKLLGDLGHQVEERHPAPLDSTEHFDLILKYWPIKVVQRLSEAEAKLGRPIREGELEPATFMLLRKAREMSMVDFGVTLKRIHAYTLRMLDWYRQGFDLLLTPTTGCPAPKLGLLGQPAATSDALRWGGFAPLVNLTGLPAISLPLHWTEAGLPLGLQLVGNIWREDMLIRVAAQLEAARPWQHRVPPVHG